LKGQITSEVMNVVASYKKPQSLKLKGEIFLMLSLLWFSVSFSGIMYMHVPTD